MYFKFELKGEGYKSCSKLFFFIFNFLFIIVFSEIGHNIFLYLDKNIIAIIISLKVEILSTFNKLSITVKGIFWFSLVIQGWFNDLSTSYLKHGSYLHIFKNKFLAIKGKFLGK